MVWFPGGADAEAEAFFSEEGGSAVDDVRGLIGSVPIEGGCELGCSGFAVAFEVINGTSGDGEVGGFGTEGAFIFS